MRLLITKRLESLNISDLMQTEKEDAIQLLLLAQHSVEYSLNSMYDYIFYLSSHTHLIMIIFQPLKTLELQGCTIPQLTFQDILPAFPKLVKLDVSGGNDKSINNMFLSILGSFCPNLE